MTTSHGVLACLARKSRAISLHWQARLRGLLALLQAQLLALLAAAGLTPRTALRTTKSPAEELGLLDPSVDDETLLAAMLDHPVLVNRPIVCTSKGVKLCRPSEAVLELLENKPKGPLSKEDGELLIDADGKIRVK